jgi:hypothetical protein
VALSFAKFVAYSLLVVVLLPTVLYARTRENFAEPSWSAVAIVGVNVIYIIVLSWLLARLLLS